MDNRNVGVVGKPASVSLLSLLKVNGSLPNKNKELWQFVKEIRNKTRRSTTMTDRSRSHRATKSNFFFFFHLFEEKKIQGKSFYYYFYHTDQVQIREDDRFYSRP